MDELAGGFAVRELGVGVDLADLEAQHLRQDPGLDPELRDLLSILRIDVREPLDVADVHGALAIRDDSLILIDTFLLDHADQKEVRSSVEYLARRADGFERSIYKTDDN